MGIIVCLGSDSWDWILSVHHGLAAVSAKWEAREIEPPALPRPNSYRWDWSFTAADTQLKGGLFVCLHIHIECMCSICDLCTCGMTANIKLPRVACSSERVRVLALWLKSQACNWQMHVFYVPVSTCAWECTFACVENRRLTNTSPMLGMRGGHLSPHHQPWLWDREGRVPPPNPQHRHTHTAQCSHTVTQPLCLWMEASQVQVLWPVTSEAFSSAAEAWTDGIILWYVAWVH